MSLKNCRLRISCLFLAIAGSGVLALADERPMGAECRLWHLGLGNIAGSPLAMRAAHKP